MNSDQTEEILETELIEKNRVAAEPIVVAQNSHPSLGQGIEAAQNGNRVEARRLLLEVVEREPDNETAWLWLASISEYPEELLIFLNSVLKINPDNERANSWLSETKSLLAKNFVQQGIDANQEGNRKFARQCFLQAIVNDENSELAWMWLASIADSDIEKVTNLKKVLSIDPTNPKALESMQRAKQRLLTSLLSDARQFIDAGDKESARRLIDDAIQEYPDQYEALLFRAELTDDINERIAMIHRVIELNPENTKAHEALEEASLERILGLLGQAKESAELGDKGAAMSMIDELLNQSPGVVDAWLLKAQIADSVSDKIDAYRTIVEMDPENEGAREALAHSSRELAGELMKEAEEAYKKGDAKQAKILAHQVLGFEPNSESAEVLICQTIEDDSERENEAKKLVERFPNNAVLNTMLEEFKMIRCIALMEQTRKAIDASDFDQARATVRMLESLRYDGNDLKMLKVQLSDNLGEKRRIVGEILAADPNHVEANAATEAFDKEEAFDLLTKAKRSATAGDRMTAIDLLDSVIALDPKSISAWLLKANLVDSFEKKSQYFSKVLEIEPENEVAMVNLASLQGFIVESEEAEVPKEEVNVESQAAAILLKPETYESPATEANIQLTGTQENTDESYRSIEVESADTQIDEDLNAEVNVISQPSAEPIDAKQEAVEVPLESETSFIVVPQGAVETEDSKISNANHFGDSEDHLSHHETKYLYADSRTEEVKGTSQQSQNEPHFAAGLDDPPAIPEPAEKLLFADKLDEAAPESETEILNDFSDSGSFESEAIIDKAFESESDETHFEEEVVEESASYAYEMNGITEPTDEVGDEFIFGGVMVEPETAHANIIGEVSKDSREGETSTNFVESVYPTADLDDVLISVTNNESAVNFSHGDEYGETEGIGTKTIMIVDDSPMIRRLISGKLQKCGLNTICAVDGAEAVDMLEDLRPDLVLLDIAMPRMDGYAVCKFIRDNEATKDVPVIMVSGKDGFFDKARGKMVGTTSFISKPFGPDALMKLVNEHLT